MSSPPPTSPRPTSSPPLTSSPRLTEASYIVLGLLEQAKSATAYELKQLAQMSTINFWSVPHTQLYTECPRLASAGLLSERQEETGRRRRIYQLTDSGREALAQWRAEPAPQSYELRDAGTLKLFFGADPATLAAERLETHLHRLARCEEMLAELTDIPRGWRLALECGIGHEREFIRFWSRVSKEAPQ